MAYPHIKIPALSEQQINRFQADITKAGTDDCWSWSRSTSRRGYGRCYPKVAGKQYELLSHRLAYFLHYGVDPMELFVCHTCDNPPCCNPAHLFLDTSEGNTADRHRKGRDSKGKEHGAKINYPKGDEHWTRLHPERLARGDNCGSRKYPERLARGEANHLSKFTEAQVKEIRQRYAQGGVSTRQLAREHSVTRTTIAGIVNRKTWKHI